MKSGLMLYVHIPFCLRKCQYCDFLSFSASKEERQLYVDALCREIAVWKETKTDEVRSVFFGGGTPSILEPDQFGQIMDALHKSFVIAKQAEQTIEVNPGTVTEEKAKMWKQKGINRISMGVQSMEDRLLERLGRIHGKQHVLESLAILKKAGFENISFDLMMGLPDQSVDQWEDTLRCALALKPQHLSCYSLILEEGTPFFEQQDALRLPDEDSERQMYVRTQQLLTEYGMHQYEISNFALDGYESRHNKGYWQRIPYIGLGLGAASLLPGEIRCKNTDRIGHYIEYSDDLSKIREEWQVLSRQEQMEEFMFLGLRCTEGVQKSDFEKAFGCSVESVYRAVLQRQKEDGLIEEKNGRIRLTRRGMDLGNMVFADFLF